MMVHQKLGDLPFLVCSALFDLQQTWTIRNERSKMNGENVETLSKLCGANI
jgi:hypothetical protein